MIRLIRNGFGFCILALVVSACSHSVSPVTTLAKKLGPSIFDSGFYSSASVTIHGITGNFTWIDISNQPGNTDTTSGASSQVIELADTISLSLGVPSHYDTLNFEGVMNSDSATYFLLGEPFFQARITFVLDTSRHQFISVNCNKENGDGPEPYGGEWKNAGESYSLQGVPYDQHQDSSITAQVPFFTNSSFFSGFTYDNQSGDSYDYQGGWYTPSDGNYAKLQTITQATSDAYIAITLKR
jgi:hypothetical protein